MRAKVKVSDDTAKKLEQISKLLSGAQMALYRKPFSDPERASDYVAQADRLVREIK